MKKLILIISVALFSCNDFDVPNNIDGYVVQDLEGWSKGHYKYWINSIDGSCSFFIYDTAAKYKIGDTLYLNKQK